MAASDKKLPLYMQGGVTAQNWRDYIASARGSAMQSVFDQALAAKDSSGKTLLERADANRSRMAELNKTLTPYDKQYFDSAAQAKSTRDKLVTDRLSFLGQKSAMDRGSLATLQNNRNNNVYQRNVDQSAQRLQGYQSAINNAQQSLQWAQRQNDQWAIQRAQWDLQNAQQSYSMEQSMYNSYRQSADFYNSNLDRQIADVNSRLAQYQTQTSAISRLVAKDYSQNDWQSLANSGIDRNSYEQLINANIGMNLFQEQAIASRRATGSQIQGALTLNQFNTLSSELASTTSGGMTLDQSVVKAVTDAETAYQQQRKTGEVKAAAARNNKRIPLTGVFGNPDPGVGLQIPGAMP